jgi:hypothetical protein
VYQGFPHISGRIATMDWIPEEINWPWLRDAPNGFRGQHRGAPREVDSDIPFSLTPLSVFEICLYVADEQRWLGDVLSLKPKC